jgi:hypothetical protein
MPTLDMRTIAVSCPYCQCEFEVPIEPRYKKAEAIPDPLPTDEGYHRQCLKCKCRLFIRFQKQIQ